jgi:hypothetical protein
MSWGFLLIFPVSAGDFLIFKTHAPNRTFMLPMVGHGKMSSELTFALRRSAK